ncbi:MAG: hypothetical protein MK364_03935, partial [Pirellulales bacterium]|nr:hypothetical protein [Pirellulales bacterium]
SEHLVAHHNLQRLYALLGQTALANRHGELFHRYRADDHAWAWSRHSLTNSIPRRVALQSQLSFIH